MSRDSIRVQANREELVERVAAGCQVDGQNIIVENLNFYRYLGPTAPKHGIYSPSICVVAQGAKQVMFGEEALRYDPNNYLLISLDVPVVSQVIEASPEKPYLGLKLDLEPAVIASVMVETGLVQGKNDIGIKSMDVSKLQDSLLDAFVRYLQLLDNPDDYRVVSPIVVREIIYRVLKSDQGPRLRQMATFGGTASRITQAVQMLRDKFDEAINIEVLAQELGMSPSSFHHHFKTATSMSPLQFQKTLRLQEARRLLLSEDIDANSVAAKVGYEDASQFSREYKRSFGEPPKRDAERFKLLATAHAS